MARLVLCYDPNPGPRKGTMMFEKLQSESGRVGYLVLYLLGAPIGVLLLLWVLLGDNLIGPG